MTKIVIFDKNIDQISECFLIISFCYIIKTMVENLFSLSCPIPPPNIVKNAKHVSEQLLCGHNMATAYNLVSENYPECSTASCYETAVLLPESVCLELHCCGMTYLLPS